MLPPAPTFTLRQLGMVRARSTGAGVEGHWRWHKLYALSSEWPRNWNQEVFRRPWRMKTTRSSHSQTRFEGAKW